MKIYYDLNISEISKPSDILRYVKCGYTRLAFNRVVNVNEFTFESDKKKISKDSKNTLRSRFEKKLAQPNLSALIDDEVKEAASKLNCEIKILSRLTLIASDVNQLTFFMREFALLVKQFDILACDARSTDVLTHASNQMPIELITFDLSNSLTNINKHVLGRCVERSISIEINLAASLATTYGRVNTVKFINELILFRCPAILTVTSGAQSPLLIRNYIGLSCILTTMGLPDKLLKEVNNNAEKAVQRGLARKHTVHGSAAIIQLNKIPGVVSVKVFPKRESTNTENSPAKKKQKTETM